MVVVMVGGVVGGMVMLLLLLLLMMLMVVRGVVPTCGRVHRGHPLRVQIRGGRGSGGGSTPNTRRQHPPRGRLDDGPLTGPPTRQVLE